MSQDCPPDVPRGAKMSQDGAQGGPKGVPRGLQGRPRCAPDVPRGAKIGQDGAKMSPDAAKMRQDDAKRGPEQTNYIYKLPINRSCGPMLIITIIMIMIEVRACPRKYDFCKK